MNFNTSSHYICAGANLDEQIETRINHLLNLCLYHGIVDNMRKNLAIIAAAVILAGVGIFIYLQKQQVPDYNISRLVSREAAFFIEVNDPVEFLEKWTHDNQMWEELSGMEALQPFSSRVNLLDSLMKQDRGLKKSLEDKKLIISAEKQGKERMVFTFILNPDSRSERGHIEGYLEKWGSTNNHQLKSRTYNKTKLHTIYQGDEPRLSWAVVNGILVGSPSRLLVEQAIRQSKIENPVTTSSGFKKIRETAGKNVVANVFINFQHLPQLLALPLDSRFGDYVKKLGNLGSWAALDMNIKPDALLLNGFSLEEPEKTEILDLFVGQEPVNMEMESILPSNTSTFISLGIGNIKEYHNSLLELYRQSNTINAYHQWRSQVTNQYGFDPRKTFHNLLHEEVGVAFLSANVPDPRKRAFIVLKTRGKRQARSALVDISRQATARAGKKPHQTQLKIDEETTYPIYKLPVQGIFSKLFGSLFSGFSNDYFTLLDNYVVFGNSPQMLKEFIYSNILNKTLNHSPNYEKFAEYLSDQSNFHFYSNLYRSPHLIAHYLNSDLKEGIDKNLSHFRKFQALAYQFMGSGEMCYNNLFIKYIPRVREEPKTVWETHLDTAIDFKPALVTNHYTDENEIFVQDLNNKIYLINNVGRILWKKQLDEEIMGGVHQIDYYKNGKLQLLFNTRHKMHLIDRNGNYVERYPVSLPSPATAPMAVFDYENNREYRFFVPCENKKIYDFYKDGDIVPGWEFGQTDTRVTSRLQHFRVDTRDYIVFADRYRIYILNRRGQIRIEPEEQFARSKNNLFTLEPQTSKNPPRLTTTDRNGAVRFVHLDGRVTTREVGSYSEDHHFDYQDIDSDGFKDFIFLDDNTLEVISQDGQEIFTRQPEATITEPPIHFYFSYQDRKIGLVSDQQNQIFLYNSDGALYEGFPLNGSTPFTIGYLEDAGGDFHLIVGNKYNFLYNYNVTGK